jgi:hypothetical protein
MPDSIDKVGLGVDIIGGGNTLAELRAIRSEMEAIAAISGGRGSTGGASTGNTAYNAAINNQRRLDKLKQDSLQKITDDEIRATADLERRKQTVKQQARQLNAQRDEADRQRQLALDLAAEEKRQQVIQRKRNQYSSTRSPSLVAIAMRS